MIIGINNSLICLLCSGEISRLIQLPWWRGGTVLGQLPSCRCLFLIIYIFLHVNIQPGVWCCRGCDCQTPYCKRLKRQKLCINEAIRKHCFSLCFCCSVNKTLKNEAISKPTKSCIQFYRNSVIFREIKMSQKRYTNNNGIPCKKANKHSPQLNKLQLINFKGTMSRPAHVRDLRSTSWSNELSAILDLRKIRRFLRFFVRLAPLEVVFSQFTIHFIHLDHQELELWPRVSWRVP